MRGLQSHMAGDAPFLARAFFERPVVEVARGLIGTTLAVDGVGGMIVEVEAYRRDDPASHSFRGPTIRNAAMFGPPGCAYIYRSYGLHWCLNVVCGAEGEGSAVLVRALWPQLRIDAMQQRRGPVGLPLLCSGPGRLCQALGVDSRLDGAALDRAPFALTGRSGEPAIVAGPRIGLSRAIDSPWRFGLAGSAFLSRPFRPGEDAD